MEVDGNDWTTLIVLVDAAPFLTYLLPHLLRVEAALLVLQDLRGCLWLHQGMVSLPGCPQIVVWEVDSSWLTAGLRVQVESIHLSKLLIILWPSAARWLLVRF